MKKQAGSWFWMLARFLRGRKAWRPDEIRFERRGRLVALGRRWSVTRRIEVDFNGLEASVMVLPQSSREQKSQPTGDRKDVYVLFDQLVKAMVRMGYEGEWRHDMPSWGPSADFHKGLRNLDDLKREFQVLDRLDLGRLL